MTKLTRKQIQEGLKQIPLDTLLLGANSKTTKLTPKQMKFAEEIAKGNSKAEAYRKAYNSKGKPKTQSNEGQKLTKDQAITAQIDAFRLALEAQKYQTSASLKAHIIHSLTQKTLDATVPHNVQIKALELLGKITEVSLFTHRVEHIKTDSSEAMKEKLIKSLSMAIKSTGATDVVEYSAESLLKELTETKPVDEFSTQDYVDDDANRGEDDDNRQGDGIAKAEIADPTTPPPQNFGDSRSGPLHSIPHTQTSTFEKDQSNQQPVSVTHVTHRVNPDVTEGEGVSKNSIEDSFDSMEDTHHDDRGSHG